MAMDLDSKLARDFRRIVGARIVDEDDVLARTGRKTFKRGSQRFRGVVGGQDDADGKIANFGKMIRQGRKYTSA